MESRYLWKGIARLVLRELAAGDAGYHVKRRRRQLEGSYAESRRDR